MPFVINIEVSFCKKAGRGTNFTKILHRLICAKATPKREGKKTQNRELHVRPKIQRWGTFMKSLLGLAFKSSCVSEKAKQIQA
jgi:hypothetical protein